MLNSFVGQNCFPFINPFYIFTLIWRSIVTGIRYVIKYIVAPFKRASFGMAHYVKLALGFFRKHGEIVWEKISKAVTNIALAIYSFIKTILIALWKGVILASV